MLTEIRICSGEAPVDVEIERRTDYPAEDYVWGFDILDGQKRSLLEERPTLRVQHDGGDGNRFQRFIRLDGALLEKLPKNDSLALRVFRTSLKNNQTVCVFGRRIVVE